MKEDVPVTSHGIQLGKFLVFHIFWSAWLLVVENTEDCQYDFVCTLVSSWALQFTPCNWFATIEYRVCTVSEGSFIVIAQHILDKLQDISCATPPQTFQLHCEQ